MKRRARSDTDARRDRGLPAVADGAFETVADRAPASIWTSSPEGALVYANDAWLEFTGRALDDEIGDGWLAGVHPDDVDAWHRAAVAERRRGFELELRVRRADGEYRWMHVRAAARQEADGTFAGWVVSSFDLTEERALNDVLRRRERQQAAMADLGRAALLGRDVDDLLEDATRVIAEVFDVDVAAAMELLPNKEFLVRAAYGFATARKGMSFPARPDTPAGITLATAGPVAFDDLRTDDRFAPATMLLDLGIISGVLVPIRARERPFGVLAAYATRYRPFVEDDIVFLRNVANVVAAAIVGRDTEFELRSREAEARLALDAGEMGSWLWDPRTGSMTWSPELERLCGLEPGSFPATFRAFVDVVHPDDRESTMQAMAEAEARGDLLVEYRVVRPDGTLRWVEGRGRPLPEGPPSRWIGVAIDVTERKHANDELHRLLDVERQANAEAEAAARALAETVARLDTLLNHAPIGLAFFDLDFRFLRVNEPLAAIDGLPIASHLGRTIEDVLPDLWPALEPSYRHVAETAEAVVGFEVGGQLASRSGIEQHFLVSVYPVVDPVGALIGIGSIVVDITERKRSELRAELIGDAGELFASPLGLDDLLGRMRDALVPRFADSCTLYFTSDREFSRAYGGGTVFVADVADTTDCAGDAHHRALVRELGLVSAISVPLGPGAEPSAVLVMGRTSSSGRRFERDDVELAEELAHRFAQAIENARLRADAARAQDRLTLLARVGELVTVELDSNARLDRVARLVLPTFADCCSVYVREPDGGARLCAFAHVDPDAQAAFDASKELPVLAVDSGAPPVEAMRRGEPSLWPTVPGELVTTVLRRPEELRIARATGIRSILAVPLGGPEEPIGALVFAYAGSGRCYGDDDVPIAQEIARRVAPALENAFRFEREQATAEILQRSLLPEELPHLDDLELTARYLPGTAGVKIGGDWYDVVGAGEGRLVFAIGDVVGHGVRAAAAMGKLRHTLQLLAFEGLAPAKILERLNAYVCSGDSGDMATLLVMLYTPGAGTAQFASAGHPPPLVKEPDGTLTFLPGGRGMPLGASPVAEYVDDHVSLPPRSVLVMYTDGLVERRREPLDVGFLRLGEALAHAPEDLDAIADHLLHAVLESDGPRDDVALLLARPLPVRIALDLRLPARAQELASLRRAVGVWLTRVGATSTEVFEITLSVNEIAANAIEHAYGVSEAEFFVEARLNGDTVTFVVRDSGQWREPPAAGDRGRGLHIVHTLMHDVEVTRGPAGTEVTMRRQLRGERGDARG